MIIDYINPFVDASYEILSQYIKDGSLKSSDISLSSNISSVSGIAAIIGLTNDICGNVVIELDMATSDKIVFMMNDNKEGLSEDIYYSTMKELVNLIGGLSVTKLEKSGFNVGLTPPMIIKGENVEYIISDSEALHVRLESSIGIFDVLVAIVSYKE